MWSSICSPCLIVVVSCLILCDSGKCTAKETVKLLAAQYSTATEPYWKGVEEAFEKENPDIDLQVEVSYWKGLHDKITTLIGAKQQPDLSIIGTAWLIEYVKEGIAVQIDDRLTSDFRGRFVDNILNGAQVDGKTYGLPIAVSVRALFYNKDHLAEAKLQPPKNWEELRAAAKALTKPGKRYGLAMPVHPDDQGDQFLYFLWAAGGDLFDPQGNVVFNSPAGVEALTFMADLHKNRLTNPEPWARNRDETQKQFITGRISLVETGNFLVPQIAKDNPKLNYGVAAIPKHKTHGTLAVTDTLAFFNRPGQNKEAVWKFINFAYGDKHREEFMKKEGMLPELKVLAEKLKQDPKLGPFVELMPTAKFLPNHEHFMPISKRLVDAVQRTLMGTEQPKQALDNAVADINKNILKK